MIQRIYIDTSILGGFFDTGFEMATRALFARLERGEVRFVLSAILDLELELAPSRVKNLLNNCPAEGLERVPVSDECLALADQYILGKVVGETSLADCQHIAVATVSRCDVLVSWNFKHIVNLDRIRGYNSINLREGYPMIEIRSPLELIER